MEIILFCTFRQHQNTRDIYQLLAFISDDNTKQLYDARQESMYRITTNLKNLVAQLNTNTPILSGTESVELIENILEKNIIFYEDLFIMYVKNSYLEISSGDMIRISSWLNNHWRSYSNSELFFTSQFITQ